MLAVGSMVTGGGDGVDVRGVLPGCYETTPKKVHTMSCIINTKKKTNTVDVMLNEGFGLFLDIFMYYF